MRYELFSLLVSEFVLVCSLDIVEYKRTLRDRLFAFSALQLVHLDRFYSRAWSRLGLNEWFTMKASVYRSNGPNMRLLSDLSGLFCCKMQFSIRFGFLWGIVISAFDSLVSFRCWQLFPFVTDYSWLNNIHFSIIHQMSWSAIFLLTLALFSCEAQI